MNRGSKLPPPASARLFPDSGSSNPPAGVHLANIDGASRGNPGPASYAVVMRDPDGKIILELAKNIGRETNNVAEYFALLAALDYATSHNISALRIRSDSELLVRQMQGRYKVKSPDLKPLFERASKLARQITYFTIEHVRREQNTDADALANVALDSAGSTKFEGGISKPLPSSPEVHRSPILMPSDRVQPPPQSIHSLRARVTGNTLVPSQPLNLPDGTEVLLDIRIPIKK
jgi:ribonuclease HI